MSEASEPVIERVQMPVVGGPRHGQVVGLARGSTAWKTIDWKHDDVLETTVYPVRKFVCILPGRTDRQHFRVLAQDEDVSLTLDAVLQAWAAGWSPPDKQSEAWNWVTYLNYPDGWRP